MQVGRPHVDASFLRKKSNLGPFFVFVYNWHYQ